MKALVLACALLAFSAPVMAADLPPPPPVGFAPVATLTPADIASLMKFLARVQIQGSEAPEFMAAVAKLQAFMPTTTK